MSPNNYAEHWKAASSALEKVRRDEIRQFDLQDGNDVVDALLQMAFEHGSPRNTSGLVTFQERLRRMYL